MRAQLIKIAQESGFMEKAASAAALGGIGGAIAGWPGAALGAAAGAKRGFRGDAAVHAGLASLLLGVPGAAAGAGIGHAAAGREGALLGGTIGHAAGGGLGGAVGGSIADDMARKSKILKALLAAGVIGGGGIAAINHYRKKD